MAIYNCAQSDLVNNSKDYRVPVITTHERKALTAYAKILQLNGVGIPDYTANYPLLFSNAATATMGINKDAMEAAQLNMEFVLAANSMIRGITPVTVPSSISAKLLAAKALIAQTDDMLDRVILYLNCSLNAAYVNP